jgi:hypothetical protein
MGMFDQFKMASEMMKNMNPDQLNDLMKQAGNMKKEMEDVVRKVVDEEIKKRGLLTREEAEKMFRK